METHEPDLVDLTKVQLPPDPVKRTPLDDSPTDEEVPLPTGFPQGIPPLNPKAQAPSDKFDWLYTEVLKEVQTVFYKNSALKRWRRHDPQNSHPISGSMYVTSRNHCLRTASTSIPMKTALS